MAGGVGGRACWRAGARPCVGGGVRAGVRGGGVRRGLVRLIRGCRGGRAPRFFQRLTQQALASAERVSARLHRNHSGDVQTPEMVHRLQRLVIAESLSGEHGEEPGRHHRSGGSLAKRQRFYRS